MDNEQQKKIQILTNSAMVLLLTVSAADSEKSQS
jgi:hypothetical protein